VIYITTRNATTASNGISIPSIVKLQQLHPAPLPGLRRCKPIPVISLPILVPFLSSSPLSSNLIYAGCALYNESSIARVMRPL